MTAACRTALLLACWVWAIHAQAQSSYSISKVDNSNQGTVNGSESTQSQTSNVKQEPQQKGSIWDEPIRFNTKAKDSCTMVISGQGDFTKLRISCKNKGKSYWCDYLGKPNLCRAYNKNPRHYFTQISWELRKLPNACQGLPFYKPHMCRLATDEAQMAFHTSWPRKQPQPPRTGATSKPPTTTKALPKPQQPAKPVKPGPKTVQPRKPIKSTTPRPTAEVESRSTKLAEEYCWSGFQGICAYFISWFQN